MRTLRMIGATVAICAAALGSSCGQSAHVGGQDPAGPTGTGADTSGTAPLTAVATSSASAEASATSTMATSTSLSSALTAGSSITTPVVAQPTTAPGLGPHGTGTSEISSEAGPSETASEVTTDEVTSVPTSTAAPSEPATSAGCGAADQTMACDTSGSPCTIDIDGVTREYYVVLPDNYDAARPYPVVFQFHPLGGNAEQGMNMYRIRPEFPDAIYVTPDGLASGNNQGWPNTGGQDEALTRAIIERIESEYCIDRNRYFSTGFSYGGSMSFTAALCMSDIFRAIGAMAGAPISGAGQCTPERPVAAWINHGEEDTALSMDLALPLRDELVVKNGCSNETVPVEPAPCVEYQGCESGYPVVWCQQAGVGHAIPNYGAAAIATFFKQF